MDCKVSEDSFLKNVHLRNVKDETFLLPSTEEEKENDSVPDQYNFVTDIFFLAHKSLDLGFRVCHEKFVKMNQELGRLQQGKHPKTNLAARDKKQFFSKVTQKFWILESHLKIIKPK